jgi:hypothetical protein
MRCPARLVVSMYFFSFFSPPTFLTTIHNKGIYTYHLFCFHSTVQTLSYLHLFRSSQYTSHNVCIPSAEILGTVLPLAPLPLSCFIVSLLAVG